MPQQSSLPALHSIKATPSTFQSSPKCPVPSPVLIFSDCSTPFIAWNQLHYPCPWPERSSLYILSVLPSFIQWPMPESQYEIMSCVPVLSSLECRWDIQEEMPNGQLNLWIGDPKQTCELEIKMTVLEAAFKAINMDELAQFTEYKYQVLNLRWYTESSPEPRNSYS